MAKIYKISMFVTDAGEEFENGDDLSSSLEEHISRLWVTTDCIEVEESKEFDWEDDLKINNTSAKKEDYEAYFKL